LIYQFGSHLLLLFFCFYLCLDVPASEQLLVLLHYFLVHLLQNSLASRRLLNELTFTFVVVMNIDVFILEKLWAFGVVDYEDAASGIKLIVRQQVPVVLGIFIEFLIGIVAVYVAGFFYADDAALVREELVGCRAVDFAFVVAVEVEFYQIGLHEFRASHRILPMLPHKRYYRQKVENNSAITDIGCRNHLLGISAERMHDAVRILGLRQRQVAIVEWQLLNLILPVH